METVKELRQRLFNRAAEGLKSQGFTRCVDTSGMCVYNSTRGDEVVHCAAGWMTDVPDFYNSGYIATELAKKPGFQDWRDAGDEFVEAIQKAHDSAYESVYVAEDFAHKDVDRPVEMWSALRDAALRFDLDASLLGDCPA